MTSDKELEAMAEKYAEDVDYHIFPAWYLVRDAFRSGARAGMRLQAERDFKLVMTHEDSALDRWEIRQQLAAALLAANKGESE